jgi:hypothetical protein
VFCGIVLPLVLVLALVLALGRPAGAEEPRVVATPGGLRPQVARVDARGVIHRAAVLPVAGRGRDLVGTDGDCHQQGVSCRAGV